MMMTGGEGDGLVRWSETNAQKRPLTHHHHHHHHYHHDGFVLVLVLALVLVSQCGMSSCH